MDKVNNQGNSDPQDTDSAERVVTSIRTGMKREFSMMMKALWKTGGPPEGRRRVNRSQSDGASSKGYMRNDGKSGEKEGTIAKSDIGGETIGEGTSSENGFAMASSTSQLKLEMKIPKKVESKKIPTKLKELLETGLLEGLHVRYIHGVKRRQDENAVQLEGVIQGTGILCFCEKCKREMVVTPNNFELHAKSRNKRPPEYIYLDNGNSLRDVLNACKVDRSYSLEMVIQNAIGRSNNTAAVCLNCAGSIPEAGAGRLMLLCDVCFEQKASDHTQMIGTAHRDLGMHKSVSEEDVLAEGTSLTCMLGNKRLDGFKKDGSFLCDCCNQVVSPSQFEDHACHSQNRKPYMGKSSSNESDNLCSIGEDGGDLFCCVNCYRAFHSECVGVLDLPEGRWWCKYCRNMSEQGKIEERDASAIAAGRVDGADPPEEITRRCNRIVGTFPSADIRACAICRAHDLSKSGFDDRTIIICDQCEKEYHVGCLKEKKIDDLQVLPDGEWFCSSSCRNINSTLQKLIEDGEQKLKKAFFNLVMSKCAAKRNPELDIKWRLLRGNKASQSARRWLSTAVSIFHDRFDPIADANKSHLDLISHMVHGMQFIHQDFCGMYCAILTVNNVAVCAASFRVFGEEVAELPLFATKSDCEGKGYFQALYYSIVKLFIDLNIKVLVVPAAAEAESFWTKGFNFKKLSDEQLNYYKKSYQMMAFEGALLLHKPVW